MFEKMFSTEMKEHGEGKVTIKDIRWEAVDQMIRYIYGLAPDDEEETDDAVLCDLFRAAHMYVFFPF